MQQENHSGHDNSELHNHGTSAYESEALTTRTVQLSQLSMECCLVMRNVTYTSHENDKH